MKPFRIRNIFIFTLAVLSGALLLRTSQNVQKTEAELSQITADINHEKESIRVLRTEWAYLNSPSRLETLARQYLKLSPTDPKKITAQIITDGASIPAKIDELPPETEMTAQPVSLVPPRKPAPPALAKTNTKPALKEKSFNDVLSEVAE